MRFSNNSPSQAIQCLRAAALQEAQRHKWIESEKLGRDLGDRAIFDWYHRFWPVFCRAKRIEHLEGRQRWDEFEREGFGRLYALIVEQDLLTDRILDRVYAGYENLDMINWAIDWGLPIDPVIEVLAQLDVNRARLDPA
ncbi:MAG: hypothetical protein ACREJB_06720 [Planctomycetaceae bacterium]